MTMSGHLTFKAHKLPEDKTVVLDRVFGPQLNKRIISLRYLTREGYKISFKNRSCLLKNSQDSSLQIIKSTGGFTIAWMRPSRPKRQ